MRSEASYRAVRRDNWRIQRKLKQWKKAGNLFRTTIGTIVHKSLTDFPNVVR